MWTHDIKLVLKLYQSPALISFQKLDPVLYLSSKYR